MAEVFRMPSPFPGMDPYLEASEIWVDFHSDLAAEIRTVLNRTMPRRYIAQVSPRVVDEVIEINQWRSARPDVGVYAPSEPSGVGSSVTVATAVAPVESVVAIEEPVRYYSVEIREVGTMRLVTAIEILSPANKRSGSDARREYLDKRRAILRSSTHLIEIDFLRGGERMPLETPVPKAA